MHMFRSRECCHCQVDCGKDNGVDSMAISLPQIICSEISGNIAPHLSIITPITSAFLRFVFAIVDVLVRGFFVIIGRLTKKPVVGMMITMMIDAAAVDLGNIDSVNRGIGFGNSLMPSIYFMVILSIAIFVPVNVSVLPVGDMLDLKN